MKFESAPSILLVYLSCQEDFLSGEDDSQDMLWLYWSILWTLPLSWEILLNMVLEYACNVQTFNVQFRWVTGFRFRLAFMVIDIQEQVDINNRFGLLKRTNTIFSKLSSIVSLCYCGFSEVSVVNNNATHCVFKRRGSNIPPHSHLDIMLWWFANCNLYKLSMNCMMAFLKC